MTYADAPVENVLPGLEAPMDIVVDFNPETLVIQAFWTPPSHPDIAGYVVHHLENGEVIHTS